jgi:phage shock protein C
VLLGQWTPYERFPVPGSLAANPVFLDGTSSLRLTYLLSRVEEAMYCNYCGKVIQDDANLCAYCGKRVGAVVARKSLRRIMSRKKVAGVCAGFAEYFDLDVTLIRWVWAIVAILGFPIGFIAYIIAWIVLPEDRSDGIIVPVADRSPVPRP